MNKRNYKNKSKDFVYNTITLFVLSVTEVQKNLVTKWETYLYIKETPQMQTSQKLCKAK